MAGLLVSMHIMRGIQS